MTVSRKHKQALRRLASARLRKSTARLRRLNDNRAAGQTILPFWKASDDR